MIDLKKFKKIIGEYLIGKEFVKKGDFYYNFLKKLIIVIGVQKSSYSNGYYINIAYIISELNPFLLSPKDVDGDVRARFSRELSGIKIDFYDINKITEDLLKISLEDNFKNYINGVITIDNLRILLSKNPVMLHQTKLNAMKLLKLD